MEVYAIRDEVADCFSAPIVYDNTKLFQRELQHLIKVQPNHPYAMSPSDYEVFHLGDYDKRTGVFELFDFPQYLFSVADIAYTAHEFVE